MQRKSIDSNLLSSGPPYSPRWTRRPSLGNLLKRSASDNRTFEDKFRPSSWRVADFTPEYDHVLSSLVIPSKFFSEVREEVSNSEGHAAQESAECLNYKRLVSPLVGFLTDVRNKAKWVQLAGHKDSFLPGRGGIVCKKSGGHEKLAYEKLMGEKSLRRFIPLFYKEVEMMDGERYLELEDLLAHFTNPNIMDIKMGVRTFLEGEVTKKKLRMDLLQKMMKLDPNEPTEEEKANGITKHRYMEYRETLSSSRNLGFRLEGIKCGNEAPNTDFKRVRDESDAIAAIQSFLPDDPELRSVVLSAFQQRLADLRDVLEQSDFFLHHECIGSSLLFLYDETGKAGIWMIDFGKTERVDRQLQHDVKWVLGTREDGYFIGLDNLRNMLGRLE